MSQLKNLTKRIILTASDHVLSELQHHISGYPAFGILEYGGKKWDVKMHIDDPLDDLSWLRFLRQQINGIKSFGRHTAIYELEAFKLLDENYQAMVRSAIDKLRKGIGHNTPPMRELSQVVFVANDEKLLDLVNSDKESAIILQYLFGKIGNEQIWIEPKSQQRS